MARGIESVSERQSPTLGQTRVRTRSEELNSLTANPDFPIGVPAQRSSEAPATACLAESVTSRREVAVHRGRVIGELTPANCQTPAAVVVPAQGGVINIARVLAGAAGQTRAACPS